MQVDRMLVKIIVVWFTPGRALISLRYQSHRLGHPSQPRALTSSTDRVFSKQTLSKLPTRFGVGVSMIARGTTQTSRFREHPFFLIMSIDGNVFPVLFLIRRRKNVSGRRKNWKLFNIQSFSSVESGGFFQAKSCLEIPQVFLL